MITNNIFSAVNPGPGSARNSPSLSGLITAIQNEIGNGGGIEDTLIQGYIREAATLAFLSTNSFSTTGNTTGYYTKGRLLRLNGGGSPVYVTVSSSSYNGVITTITTVQTTVPNPLNTVDLALQPKGYTAPLGGNSGQYAQSDGAGGLTFVGLVINRGFSWFIAGSPAVGNDLSQDYTVPEGMTCVKFYLHAQVAPTGSAIILRLFNITQGVAIGSITLNTSATDVSSTTFTTPALHQGDVIRIDCTQADSNGIGINLTGVLECTQP